MSPSTSSTEGNGLPVPLGVCPAQARCHRALSALVGGNRTHQSRSLCVISANHRGSDGREHASIYIFSSQLSKRLSH